MFLPLLRLEEVCHWAAPWVIIGQQRHGILQLLELRRICPIHVSHDGGLKSGKGALRLEQARRGSAASCPPCLRERQRLVLLPRPDQIKELEQRQPEPKQRGRVKGMGRCRRYECRRLVHVPLQDLGSHLLPDLRISDYLRICVAQRAGRGSTGFSSEALRQQAGQGRQAAPPSACPSLKAAVKHSAVSV